MPGPSAWNSCDVAASMGCLSHVGELEPARQRVSRRRNVNQRRLLAHGLRALGECDPSLWWPRNVVEPLCRRGGP